MITYSQLQAERNLLLEERARLDERKREIAKRLNVIRAKTYRIRKAREEGEEYARPTTVDEMSSRQFNSLLSDLRNPTPQPEDARTHHGTITPQNDIEIDMEGPEDDPAFRAALGNPEE